MREVFSASRGLVGPIPSSPTPAAARRSRAGAVRRPCRRSRAASISQLAVPWWPSREARIGHGRAGSGQGGQDRQPAEAVSKDMMEHHDQGDPASGGVGDQRGPPQGPAVVEPGTDQLGRDRQHLPVLAGVRAVPHGEMVVQVELRVVDPHRAPAAGRRRLQPLPQPGNGWEPFGQQHPHLAPGGSLGGLELQHGSDVHRDLAAVAGQHGEIHRARPVDSPPKRSGRRVDAPSWPWATRWLRRGRPAAVAGGGTPPARSRPCVLPRPMVGCATPADAAVRLRWRGSGPGVVLAGDQIRQPARRRSGCTGPAAA